MPKPHPPADRVLRVRTIDADLVGDRAEGVTGRDDRRFPRADDGVQWILVSIVRGRLRVRRYSPSSGLTLRTAARYVVRGRVLSSPSSE